MSCCLRIAPLLATGALLVAACGTPDGPELVAAAEAPTVTPEPTATPQATAAPEPTATPVPTPAAPATATPGPTAGPSPDPTASPTPVPLVVHEQDHQPMAVTSNLTLTFPATSVQYVGFHESGHDGSQQMDLLDPNVQAVTLASRGRLTGDRTAADVVVAPDAEIRAPITGTVLSAGTYVLYCEYSDDFVYIAPDGQPGWEVKIFHIDGVQVSAGDRVEAGVTVIAPRATQLPFESQVDAFTAEPSWPHVHIEIVDPSIPDVNKTGSGGC